MQMGESTTERVKLFMRRTLISALLLASPGSLCPATSQLEVTAVRFWTLSDITRVAVETNGGFRFRSDRLENPDRLFFDLLGAKPRTGDKGIHVTAVGDKLLKRIRVAETQPGMTRVVLDLESPVDFTASQLSNPDRLIIELRPVGQPQISSTQPERKPSETADQKPPAPPAAEPKVRSKLPLKTEQKLPAKPAEPAPAQLSTATVETSEVRAETSPRGEPALTAKLDIPHSQAIEPPPPAVKPVATDSRPAFAAKRMSTGDRTLVRELGLKIGRVVIDAGHGGYDHGSTGPGGLMEKELTLDVALRLAKLIEQRLGSEVILTRSDDTFVPLETRTALANDSRADLFLSIHANSSPYPSVSGVETYYLNFSSTRDEMEIASRENAGAQQTIHELGDIIVKITKHDKAEESREFATKMQTALYGVARSNPSAKNRGVKKAPFIVLIGARMPSILAEIGFISNSRDEALLKRPDHRQKIAEALYRGLSRYAETLSHYQVASRD
jgi:N-acetylmuramoyl-L-alanine amidase